MKTLSVLAIMSGLSLISAPAYCADVSFQRTGSAKLAAYAVCHSLSIIDMGKIGQQASTECVGIVKSKDAEKNFDNLSIRCLEETRARGSSYAFTGTCIETDGDGDKVFLGYEGPESGLINLIGGTGKYAGLEGSGKWTVQDAPGNTASQFLFTLEYNLDWRPK